MNIEPRGPRTFLLTWELGRDPATGHRQRQRQTFHGTHKQAQAAWHKHQEELERGTAIHPDAITVGAWMITWLDGKSSTLRPSTVGDYRNCITARIVPALGALPLQQLSAAAVQGAIHQWQAQGLSPRSIRYTVGLVRTACDLAVRWHLIAENPTRWVAMPPARPARLLWWEPEHVQRFVAAVQDHPWGVGFGLALFAGLRRGEICGLRWDQVAWDPPAVAVTRNRVVVTGGIKVAEGDPKTAKGIRTIPLDAGMATWLRTHRAHQEAWRRGHPDVEDSGYVLQNRQGHPIHPSSWSHAFMRSIADLEVPKIRPHDLRHTFGSGLVAQGTSVRVVADLLGHTRISFTLDTYIHAGAAAHRAATEALAARFRPQNGHNARHEEGESKR